MDHCDMHASCYVTVTSTDIRTEKVTKHNLIILTIADCLIQQLMLTEND